MDLAVMLVLGLRLGLGLGIQVLGLGLGLGLDSVGPGQMLSCYTPVSIVIFLGVYCLAFFFVNCH